MESEEFICKYLCTRQHAGSGGTLLQKESGIGNSLTMGDELVHVLKTILLYSLKLWSLGNWRGVRLVLPKDWHMSANYGKFQRKYTNITVS
jgi:hypothetical protein